MTLAKRSFFEVICPMLMLDETVLICISTVRGTHNFFSRLRNLRDDTGELVFSCVDFKLECPRPECKRNPEDCPHVLAQLPSHMSANKAARVKALMSGEHDLFLQETRGVEIDPTTPLYQKGDLDWLFDKANRYARLPYVNKRTIFTLVDPNAGGLSNYAIVSFVLAENFIVVRRRRRRRR